MTHGTRYGYQRGCRCEECREAENSYQRAWTRANYDRRIVDHNLRDVARVPRDQHGRHSTYTNRGCRCEDCTAARREYAREYARGYRSGVRRRARQVPS